MSLLSQFMPTARRVAVFTSSGSWTVPTGVYYVDILAVGGGGGGGRPLPSISVAEGGGGGCVAFYRYVPVTPGSTLTITVGAGGTGGSIDGVGGNVGGTTQVTNSVGLNISAPGGSGGGPSAGADPNGVLDPNPHRLGESLPIFGTRGGYSNQLFGNTAAWHGGSCLRRGPTTTSVNGAANSGCGGAGGIPYVNGGNGGSGAVYIFY